MSDLPPVEGKITIDSSGAQRGVNDAVTSLSSLEDIVRNNWWGLRNLGLAFGALSTGIVAAFAMATKAAVDWESSMAGLERTLWDSNASAQENEQSIGAVGDQLRDLATIKPIEAGHLANIAEEAGALGIASDDVAAFTSVVADLAATTDLTEQEATTGFARIAGIMGVPDAMFKQLASSILETGRSTQATEPQIVQMATRLAGIGATVGLTADQLIGLSAAVSSVGIRAEMGSTAIAKTFMDMIDAISQGGDQLEAFGNIAGMTGAQFQELFGRDAGAALTQFVTGVGQMSVSGKDVTGTLKDMGISETRQVQTLLRLGAAQTQNVNENLKMSKAMEIASNSFEEGTALQEIAGRRYQTLAAQMQITQNLVAELAREWGTMFLPVLRVVNTVLANFLQGMLALPPNARVAITVLAALTGVVASFTAAVFLLGPRILLMRQSLNELANAHRQAAASAEMQNAAYIALIANAQRLLTSQAGLTAGQAMMARNSLTAASNMGAVTSTAGAGIGVIGTMASKVGKLGKAAGWLGLALTVVGGAIAIFGSRQKKATDAADEAAQVNQELVSILQQQGDAAMKGGAGWVAQQLVMLGVIPVAKRLKVQIAALLAVIQGAASASQIDQVLGAFEKAEKGGDKEAGKALDTIAALHHEYGKAAEVAGYLAGARGKLSDSTDDAADSEGKMGDKLKETNKWIREINEAASNYASTLFQQRRAQIALKEAQEAYNKALEEAKDPTYAIQKAENNLGKERLTLEKANDTLRQAEEDLASARRRQRRMVEDAEDALADARERREDSLRRIEDAEDKLREARKASANKAEDLADAERDLERASYDLKRARQQVEDAEWQLQYLREEGASNRDIEDAEAALEDARLDQADAADAVEDAEKDLQDIRSSKKYLQDIEDAERDLKRARRDAVDALRDIRDREEDLNKQRRDAARDTEYKKALQDLKDAQFGVRDAQYAVRDAELELKAVLNGKAQRELESTTLDLEEAIYDLAEANANAVIASKILQGEHLSERDKAEILRKEIGKLMGLAPTTEGRRRLGQIMSALGEVRNEAEDTFGEGGPMSLKGMKPTFDGIDELKRRMSQPAEDAEKKGLGQRLKDALFGAFTGAGIGATIGSVIPGVGTVVGAVVGAVIGGLIGGLSDKFPGVLKSMGNFFTKTLPNAVSGFLGLGKGGKGGKGGGGILKGFGGELVGGFLQGMVEKIPLVGPIIGGFTKQIKNPFKTTPSWLIDKGRGVISGLSGGMTSHWPGVSNWLSQRKGNIAGFFNGASGWLSNPGQAIMHGLFGGVTAGWDKKIGPWFKGAYQKVKDFFSGAYGWLFDSGRNLIQGLWDGVKAKWHDFEDWVGKQVDKIPSWVDGPMKLFSPSRVFRERGNLIMEGLILGIRDQEDMLQRTIESVARDVQTRWDTLSPAWEASGLETGTLSRAAALGGDAGAGTVINEGDTFNLDAVTTADPNEIINEFFWQKMVRVD